MTNRISESFRTASLHLHQGDGRQAKAIVVHRYGDHVAATYDPERTTLDTAIMLIRTRLHSEGITVSDVILEGHEPDLAALYRAASKLLLDVELTRGPLITEPAVKVCSQNPMQAAYLVPEGWDLSDALAKLPAAFASARPKVTRDLELIERAKKHADKETSEILQMLTLMVLETDDPAGVYDEMQQLLHQVPHQEGETAATSAT